MKRLGRQLKESKHRICESITGRKYEICLANMDNHYWAICYFKDIDGYIKLYTYDRVNYKTGEFEHHK